MKKLLLILCLMSVGCCSKQRRDYIPAPVPPYEVR